MSDIVRRYNYRLSQTEDGVWVKYSDYAALEQRCKNFDEAYSDLYAQYQKEILEIKEMFRNRTAHMGAQNKALMQAIVDVKACQPPAPIMIPVDYAALEKENNELKQIIKALTNSNNSSNIP